MTHGWSRRAGQIVQAGIGAMLLVGPVGCLSDGKKRDLDPQKLQLPSKLPDPTVPIPSKSSTPSSTTTPAQPTARTFTPPAFGTPDAAQRAAALDGTAKPMSSFGALNIPSTPGSSAANFPPPGGNRSVASTAVLPAPTSTPTTTPSDVTPLPLQGNQAGLRNPLPPEPPPLSPPVSGAIANIPPLPSAGTPEVVSSSSPSGGLVAPTLNLK